jgi:hypothetical protein
MFYRDLVQFEAVETIIQLGEAKREEKAKELVKSYVISQGIEGQLTDIIFPQLQFRDPLDNKGLLIVGNYGTGKSHLMSLVSSVAENASLREFIRNQKVAEEAASFAGQFKVIRIELGGSGMTLRDIIIEAIQGELRNWGVEYTFPPLDRIPNNKGPIVEMMGKFQEVFPEQGLLIVVDELLDFLRARKEQELIQDLNFLREVGEVCATTRFRFIAGVQEALFESPRFQFAADSLRRVKDRFNQVRIVKEDVAYVVSERLLQKSDKQKEQIQNHLQKFTPLYDHMAERMDEFVDLFPIHPAYLDAFEQMSIAENREIFKTTSGAIKKVIDNKVPEDEPGLLTYDHYWDIMQGNSALRSIPEVRDVLDKSKVLEERVSQALTIPFYKPAALRIIRALSVHRLTTDDIYTPIGLTAEELRDQLCLFLPGIPPDDSEFLKTTIEAVLKEISKTVSGQFISSNTENGQYYLDLKKDIDYDALIDEKAETLDNSQLDSYFFEALIAAMECPISTYVSGFKIWEHDIQWLERNSTRKGYLFFGTPNQRSTAQPPRDFYLYFLQPLDPPKFDDEKNKDEVYFKLSKHDQEFREALKYFAATRELASTASRTTRSIYDAKGEEYRRVLTNWLQENVRTGFDVTYGGVSKTLNEWLRGQPKQDSFRDQINQVASVCLAPYFQEQAPEYPTFANLITFDNIQQAMGDALKWISGQGKPRQGGNVLTALELLEGERIDPANSRYARHVMTQLKEKGKDRVLNRDELIEKHFDGVEYDSKYRLEPELLVVVLASLIYNGEITMNVGGLRIDASNLEELTRMSPASLVNFTSIAPPKDIPVAELRVLFELLELPPGLIGGSGNREDAVRQMQAALEEQINKVLMAQERLKEGFSFWGEPLLSEEERESCQRALEGLNEFLQPLGRFDRPAKLRNFKATKEEIDQQRPHLAELERLNNLKDLLNATSAQIMYLSTAETAFKDEHPWSVTARTAKQEMLSEIKQAKEPEKLSPSLKQRLDELKTAYIEAYYQAHQKARLNRLGGERKKELRGNPRLVSLNRLQMLDWYQTDELNKLQADFGRLKECDLLTKSNLSDSPLCPHCGFRPREEEFEVDVQVILDQIELDLEGLHQRWTSDLIKSLDDPSTQQDFSLLPEKEQKRLQEIIDSKRLPDILDNDLLNSIKNVLKGLEPVRISMDGLFKELKGSPYTKDEFKKRFLEYLDSVTMGKDQTKVRIIIE